MALQFITGNKNKFEEFSAILAPINIEQREMELTEIQSLDAQKIIEHKLREALNHARGEFLVEDTSLYLECLNDKLPGPYIKWFSDVLTPEGIYKLAQGQQNTKARAVCLIGHYKDNVITFFEGSQEGKIVSPIGDKDFGWGPIFKPQGWDKTYGQMEREEKYSFSMRGLAAHKLKDFLLNNK